MTADVGDQYSFKNRDAIYFLPPHHCFQAIVWRHELLFYSGLIEHLRSMPKEISIFEQKSFRCALRISDGEA